MDFQFIQFPLWAQIMNIIAGVVPVLAIVNLCIAKNTRRAEFFALIGVAIAVTCVMGCFGGGVLNTQQNNASFSQQLMDEYHATSNRPLDKIKAELDSSGGSNAVFTKDGKATPVFIKLVNHDDKDYMTMQFLVLDDRSLYPKP